MAEFEIPFKSDLVPQTLELGSKLKFSCHPGVSCFNACCKHADITLTPYDVIRMKDSLGITSTDFLKKHTVPFQMDGDGVPGIKLRTTDEGACLLVDDEKGCTIYEDRPTACRYYPIGHMAMKPKDATVDEVRYFMINEDHCKGHDEDKEQTIQEFLSEQGVADFDNMNKEWLQVMLKKKSAGPTVGTPPESSLQLFFMASFDVDRFRRFVMSDAFKKSYDLEDSVYETFEKEDIALMLFGTKLLKQVLFGEKTIPEKDQAWEKRLETREEVWNMRKEVEIKRRQKKEDDKYSDENQ